jgi:hypothetical protein
MGDCCSKCGKQPCGGLVAVPNPIWGANPPRAGGGWSTPGNGNDPGAGGCGSGTTAPGGASGGGSGTVPPYSGRLAAVGGGDTGTTVNAAGASTMEIVAIGLAGLLVGAFGVMLMRKQNPVHVRNLHPKKRRRLRRARRSSPNLYRRR